MINSKYRKAIITNWILSSREYRSIHSIKTELTELIESAALEFLTDDEKEYIKLFGVENVRKQKDIDWHDFYMLSERVELNLPSLGYNDYVERTFLNKETYGYLEAYDNSLIKGISRYEIDIEIKDNIPVLFNNPDDFLLIKKRNKPLYNNLLDKIRSYLTQLQSLKIKFDHLCTVLCSKDIELADLKEYYVELYNLRK